MTIEIKLASTLGFCFGVRRALEIMDDAAKDREQIDSLGSIVHNSVVAEDLAAHDIRIVNELENVGAHSVAITAHGAGPEVHERITSGGHELIDTTCPIVARAQIAARKLVDAGFKVVLYGDANHAEVKGVVAWAKNASVVASADVPIEIPGRKVALLSQTTKSHEAFSGFVAEFLNRNLHQINEVRIINTTCMETEVRYEAARDLSSEVDLMIVIGGRDSANTSKLATVCRSTGVTT
ncbi:MAG TPA: 4-hydroxy-3-methylbut-2-enyl diphosphate reductase, partial [Dehalococcoidia bacterium]|nr:4-hydroxy-3-methylbut-2-enyl diphosphate reductase [Dehalococcoidia bacterium]